MQEKNKKKDGMKGKQNPKPAAEESKTAEKAGVAADPKLAELAKTASAEIAGQGASGEETAALKEEVAQLRDQLLRSMAEAENIRKRAQRDLEDSRKYAVTGFAQDLLNVLDNFYRTEEYLPQDIDSLEPALKNLIAGIKLTHSELARVFEMHGIRRIDPKGQPFDHNQHQAIAQVPDANVPPNTVVQVVQAGYMLHERLLRPAMVAVSTQPQ